MRERSACEGVIPPRPVLGFFSPRTRSWRTCSTSVAWSSRNPTMLCSTGSRWTPWFLNSRSAKPNWGSAIRVIFLLRAQELLVQLADALQGVLDFAVVAQPLLDHGFLFGG